MSRLGLDPRKAMRANVEFQPLPDASGLALATLLERRPVLRRVPTSEKLLFAAHINDPRNPLQKGLKQPGRARGF
jgi:hypothetical protein